MTDGLKPWWEALGVSRLAGTAVIRDAHRKLTIKHRDGPVGRIEEIGAARDAAIKERGQ